MSNTYYDFCREFTEVKNNKRTKRKIVVGHLTMTPQYLSKGQNQFYLAPIMLDNAGNVKHASGKEHKLYKIAKMGDESILEGVKQNFDESQKGTYRALAIGVQKGEKTEFVKVLAFGKLAKALIMNYEKGQKVIAEFRVESEYNNHILSSIKKI